MKHKCIEQLLNILNSLYLQGVALGCAGSVCLQINLLIWDSIGLAVSPIHCQFMELRSLGGLGDTLCYRHKDLKSILFYSQM